MKTTLHTTIFKEITIVPIYFLFFILIIFIKKIINLQ